MDELIFDKILSLFCLIGKTSVSTSTLVYIIMIIVWLVLIFISYQFHLGTLLRLSLNFKVVGGFLSGSQTY
jgi:hypothetical protein